MPRETKRIEDFTFADLYYLLDCYIPAPRMPRRSYPCGGKGHENSMSEYVISRGDAEFLMEMTTIPVWCDPETDLYFFGQCFCGGSPSDQRLGEELTEAGVEYLKEIGYTED